MPGGKSPQPMPWHKHYLIDPTYNRVDLVKEGANSKAKIKLVKSKGGTTMELTLEAILEKMKPEHAAVVTSEIEKAKKGMSEEEVAEKLAAKDEEIAKLRTDLETAKQDTTVIKGKDSEEEILKSVKDPAMRSLLETQIAKAKAAEAMVKKMRDEQMEREAISKAKEVPAIGAEEAKIVEVYKKLKDTDEALCNDVFNILKSANALITKSAAFTEVGAGGAGASAGDAVGADEESAWAAIEKAADTIAKERNIAKSAAISEAIQNNPQLYQAYINAQRG